MAENDETPLTTRLVGKVIAKKAVDQFQKDLDKSAQDAKKP